MSAWPRPHRYPLCWKCGGRAFITSTRAYHLSNGSYIVDRDWYCLTCKKHQDGTRETIPLAERQP